MLDSRSGVNGCDDVERKLADIAWRMSSPQVRGDGSFIVPIKELEKFEGIRSDIVTLEVRPKKRAVARWQERDQEATASVGLTSTDLVWPQEPKHLASLPGEFLRALHEAGRTTDCEPGKYASDRIQLRGQLGQLVATDGKQALIQRGYTFPFADDLLIPAIPVFSAKEVAGEDDTPAGRTTGMSLRAWTRHQDDKAWRLA